MPEHARASPASRASVRRLASDESATAAQTPAGASSASRQPTCVRDRRHRDPRDEPADRHAHLLDAHEQAAVTSGRRTAHDHVRRRRDQPVGESHCRRRRRGRTPRPGRTPPERSRSRPRRPRPRAWAARRSGPSAGPTAPRVIAAPPNTIAVIAPICQRASERSERISGASGAKPSVAYEPAAIDERAQRDGPGAAGRTRARERRVRTARKSDVFSRRMISDAPSPPHRALRPRQRSPQDREGVRARPPPR